MAVGLGYVMSTNFSNMFNSYVDDDDKISSRCAQPVDNGFGTNPSQKWAWSKSEKACIKFTYYGEGGNDNRFNWVRQCRSNCDENFESHKKTDGDMTIEQNSNFALEQVIAANPEFAAAWAAQQEKKKQVSTGSKPSKCTKAKDPGYCRACIERWYWDAEKGKCDTFCYGGCAPDPTDPNNENQNNFITEDQCKNICG